MHLLERALSTAKHFAVFPVSPNGKRPLFSKAEGGRGVLDATRDPDQIRAWWTATPDANIGIHPAATGWLVVDLDIKPDVDGRVTWTENFGGLDDTFTVETPSGGLHLYYRLGFLDDAPGPSRGRLGPGVDVRCHNSYVLAPGSVVDGKPYRVIGKRAAAPVPAPVLQRSGEVLARAENAGEWLVDPDLPRNVDRARRYVADLEADECEGARSDSAYRYAAQLREFGCSEETTAALLEQWNARLAVPLPDDRLAGTVANAYLYAKRPAGALGLDTLTTFGADILAQCRPPGATLADLGKEDRTEPAGTATSGWPLFTPAEADAQPVPSWTIDEVIPSDGIAILYGPRSSLKTFVALDMALCIATGRPWGRPADGHEIINAGPVVFAAGEGAGRFRFRRQAWEQSRGVTLGAEFMFSDRLPRLGDEAEVVAFIQALKPLKPAAVFLDTLTRAMSGLDENKAPDHAMAYDAVSAIQRHLGCPVILIGHTGKDVGQGLRGSSVLPDNVDTMLLVEREGDRVAVKVTKQKDGRDDFKPWTFKLRQLDSERLTLEPISPDQIKSAKRIEADYRRAVAVDVLCRVSARTMVAAHLAEAMATAMAPDDGPVPDSGPLLLWLKGDGAAVLADRLASSKPLEFFAGAPPTGGIDFLPEMGDTGGAPVRAPSTTPGGLAPAGGPFRSRK